MNYNFLSKTELFRGCGESEIKEMIHCLGAKERTYEKDEIICRAGETVSVMGLILSGTVSIESDDFWGNRSILDLAGPGHVFAEAYACVPEEPLMVNAVAAGHCVILELDVGRILSICPNGCSHHSRLIRNLLSVCARKNLTLSRRIFHTSAKSIRGRLLSYLSFQASRAGSCDFVIPFSRQELADYLSVDRSALSNELGKMKKDGLLTVHKNHFCLNPDATSAYAPPHTHPHSGSTDS